MTAWDDLVAAATVGTDTRTINPADLPEPFNAIAGQLDASNPAAQLLDLAAIFATAIRAGRQLDPAPALTTPAEKDTAPEISDIATAILQGIMTNSTEALLSDVLLDINAAGNRAPAGLLPALLAAGGRSTNLREAVLGVLGNRGRWLADQNPAWRWVAKTDIPDEINDDPTIWETGSAPQRKAWFAQSRRIDAAAALAILETGWATETPDDRAAFLWLLLPELTLADEPFLERALDDGRAAVRTAAQDLLRQLPNSGLQQRMRDRASRMLQIERKLLRRRLLVTLPDECDASMLRDGITKTPTKYRAIGEKAFWLQQILAAAPLDLWPEPDQIWGLEAADAAGTHFTHDVMIGLFNATVQQRNAAWARTILGADYSALRQTQPEATLLALLPTQEQFEVVTALVKRTGLKALSCIPDLRPWPAELSVAVLDELRKLAGKPETADGLVLTPIGRHLPALPGPGVPDYLVTLHQLIDQVPPVFRLHRTLMSIADTVALRRRLLEELR